MGQQANDHPQLNLLAREVLAAASVLEAVVLLHTPAPMLQTALAEERIDCRLLG